MLSIKAIVLLGMTLIFASASFAVSSQNSVYSAHSYFGTGGDIVDDGTYRAKYGTGQYYIGNQTAGDYNALVGLYYLTVSETRLLSIVPEVFEFLFCVKDFGVEWITTTWVSCS